MDNAQEVNQHYLDHVVATAATHQVEASEDILSKNGMKLLAKGARIDGSVRDRLLQHKLLKPLEDCITVTGGITLRLGDSAGHLVEKHAFLRKLLGHAADTARDTFSKLKLSMPMQSLLTVYCEVREDKIDHAVLAALLAQGLAQKLLPGQPESGPTLRLAGLFHDVGELYINPAFLAKGVRLAPEQWRHIVTHPLVGHRVLKDMPGAGKAVAEPVLQHHERLDGFGYPMRLSGDKLPMPGQILATAEMLTGLIESAPNPLSRASIAMKLMPGEFARTLIDAVSSLSQSEDKPAGAAALEDNLPRVQGIAATLQRFHRTQDVLLIQMNAVSDKLKPVIGQGMERLRRIQTAFSSTGMDAQDPAQLANHLGSQLDAGLHLELTTVLRELEWRLRELERESMLRADLLSPGELPVVQNLIQLLKGKTPEPAGL